MRVCPLCWKTKERGGMNTSQLPSATFQLPCSLLHALGRMLALVLIALAVRDRREAPIIFRRVQTLAALLVGLEAHLLFARRRLLFVCRGMCRRLSWFRHSVRLQL